MLGLALFIVVVTKCYCKDDKKNVTGEIKSPVVPGEFFERQIGIRDRYFHLL